MALADSVPGVSGGTVAFLLGFYDKFITSLDHLMSGTKEERIEAIKFLIRIGIGWVIGMGAAVSVLASIFDDKIYEISSLFLGLIIFAIPMICKEERDSLKGKYQNIIFVVIGVVLVAAITYFNPVSGKGISVSVEHLNVTLGIYIFAVAMVAISAMVLPGISGSTMLLIFGLYIPVITAVKEVMHLNLSYFPVVVIFGLGVLTGIALVIKLSREPWKITFSNDLFCHWNDDRVFICNRYGTNNTGEYEGSNDTSYVPSGILYYRYCNRFWT